MQGREGQHCKMDPEGLPCGAGQVCGDALLLPLLRLLEKQGWKGLREIIYSNLLLKGGSSRSKLPCSYKHQGDRQLLLPGTMPRT